MSFATPTLPTKKFFSVKFKGLDLRQQKWISGIAYVEAWNLEDAAQQAADFRAECDIVWENSAEVVGRIEPSGVFLG